MTTGKLRMDLIAPEMLISVASVMTYASETTGQDYPDVTNYGEHYATAIQHLASWWGGQNNDPENGLPHLAIAAACIGFLMTYENRGIGHDDRPNIYGPMVERALSPAEMSEQYAQKMAMIDEERRQLGQEVDDPEQFKQSEFDPDHPDRQDFGFLGHRDALGKGPRVQTTGEGINRAQRPATGRGEADLGSTEDLAAAIRDELTASSGIKGVARSPLDNQRQQAKRPGRVGPFSGYQPG